MSIRKANYKRLLTLVLAMCMLMGVSLTASAAQEVYSYNFNIPAGYINSARYTGLKVRKTTDKPFVQPSVVTIPTYYYLAPDGSVSTAATEPIPVSDKQKHNLEWNDDYGGIGSSYRLVGYPGVLSDYDAYNPRGSWAD